MDDSLVRRFVKVGGRVDDNRWAVYGLLKALAFFCRVNGVSPSRLVGRLQGWP